MLENIRAHSVMVARVAYVLLQGLTESSSSSAPPAENLVVAGALLHDIAKTPCLKSHCNHAEYGGDICLELGYPEVAEVVREHVMLMDFSVIRFEKGDFLAKELVYYADKRVRHDEIVSLKERLAYILENYGNNDPKRHSLIKENFDKCFKLEQFLFSGMDLTINDIKKIVATSPF